MNAKMIPGIFIVALIVMGCITEYNATFPSNETEVLFVDGNIMENTMSKFYITQSFSMDFIGGMGGRYTGEANVFIIGNNGYKSMRATYMNGYYQIWVDKLDDDVEYGLQIEHYGEIYQSALMKPLRTPEIDSISWVQPEPAGSVSFRVSTHDNTGKAKFFLWDYTEDWEIVSNFNPELFFNPRNSVFYLDYSSPYLYCWKNSSSKNILIGSTESLRENKIINKMIYQRDFETDRLSYLYCVTVNQQAISKGAYEYYQSMKKMNEEMGGIFTPQPTELTGNITCITNPSKKIAGYIDVVKNTTQKRMFVYQSQLKLPRSQYCPAILHDSLMAQEAESMQLMTDKEKYLYLYNSGYRPIAQAYPRIFPEYWSTVQCVDCTSRGGSKIKPDFWPNDHK